jgi:starch synthase (maltosyl-transferring)
MNTGLDARFDERYRLHPEDEFYGKLGFFDKYALHWTNPLRWDLPDTLEAVSKIRNTYLDTITSPECFVPIDFANEKISAIGLAYVIKGRRWKPSDNLLIIVCNTDIYNDQEYTLFLDSVREHSGNSSKKAWLAFSANEWSHDIYDYDDCWNLHLKFKPGEVKILLM